MAIITEDIVINITEETVTVSPIEESFTCQEVIENFTINQIEQAFTINQIEQAFTIELVDESIIVNPVLEELAFTLQEAVVINQNFFDETQNTEITLGVTTPTIVSSVNVDLVAAVKWSVHFQGNINPLNKKIVEIIAFHDGTVSFDAGQTLHHVVGLMRFGIINGLSYDVILTGTGSTQKIELQITSTDSVDVRVITSKIRFS